MHDELENGGTKEWTRQDLNPEALLRKNNARIEIKGYKSEKGEGRKCGPDRT